MRALDSQDCQCAKGTVAIVPTHPITFGENTLVKRLIATHRNLSISPEYSKDTAEICRRCVPTTPFQLADPNVVLSLLGYC
jgi:hypothetical protein